MSSRPIGFKQAAILGAIARVVSILARFVSIPLLVTVLSSEQLGLWLILGTLIAWLGFSDFGVPSALQNRLTVLLASDQGVNAKAIVCFSFRFLVAVSASIFCTALVIALLFPWRSVFQIDSATRFDFVAALLLSMLAFTIGLPARIGAVIFTSHGFLAVPVLSDIVAQVISLTMLILAAKLNWNSLAFLAVASLIAVCVGPVIVSLLAFQKFGYSIAADEASVQDKKLIIGKGFFFLVTMIGELMILQSDTLIIGLVLGVASIPLFIIPNMLFLNYLQLQNIFLRPLWPVLTYTHATGDKELLKRVVMNAIFYSIMGGLVFSILLIIGGDWFITWWSRGAASLPPIMAWGFALYVITASIDNCLATCLNALGKIELRFAYTFFFGLTKVVVGLFVLQFGSLYWLPLTFAAVMAITSVPFAVRFLVQEFTFTPRRVDSAFE